MKNIKQLKRLKCIRAKCQSHIALNNKLAKQIGLCENHFNIYQHQYFHCDYCRLLSKRKKNTIDNYCSYKCQRLHKIIKQKWFKVINTDINRISINFKDDKIRKALFYPLQFEPLINDIKLIYELKKSKKNIKLILKRCYSKLYHTSKLENYFSVLDISICPLSAIVLGNLYLIAPSIITNKIEKNNFLLEMIEHDKQESFDLLNYLDSIFSIQHLNKNSQDNPHNLEEFIFSFSQEEPYNDYPILKLLYYYLTCLEEGLDTKEITNSKICQLSSDIVKIKFDKKCNDINSLYIELFSLILLYSLIYRDKYENIFIELCELLIKTDIGKIKTNIDVYLYKWLDFKLPCLGDNDDKYYLEFYQSLFLVYKQKIPNAIA